jgi:hypothetical protein
MNASARHAWRPFTAGIWGAWVAALLWSVGLAVAAVTWPVYSSDAYVGSATVAAGSGEVLRQTSSTSHTSATLLAVNGSSALFAAALPLVITLLVGIALLRPRSGRAAAVLAWVCVCLLGVFTLLSMLTIGLWLLPVTDALTLACALHTGRAWSARPVRL